MLPFPESLPCGTRFSPGRCTPRMIFTIGSSNDFSWWRYSLPVIALIKSPVAALLYSVAQQRQNVFRLKLLPVDVIELLAFLSRSAHAGGLLKMMC